MASVSEASKRLVALKVKDLQEQRRCLHKAVDVYVNKVVSSGTQWTNNEEDHNVSFLEVSQNIGSAVDFLYLKHTEISEQSDKYSLQAIVDSDATSQTGSGRKSEKLPKQDSKVDLTLSSSPSKIPDWAKIQEKRMEENEERVKRITSKVDQMENLTSELDDLRNQLHKLSENQNLLQDQISSRIYEDLEQKFAVMRNETDFLKKSVTSAFDRNESILETLSRRTDSVEKVTTNLSDRMSTNQETLENVTIKEDSIAMAIEDIQAKIVLLETKEVKYPEAVENKLTEVETNYNLLRQMFINRLQPLEKLRRILNGNARVRDGNVRQLQEVVREVAAITPRIAAMELRSSRTVFGFTAAASDLQNVALYSTITRYGAVYYNEHGDFDPFSGVFTAPEDGVYVICIIIKCDQNDFLQVHVSCNGSYVCSLQNNDSLLHTCNFCLFKMKTGDKLFAKVMNQRRGNSLHAKIKFSCFFIGR